MKLHSVILWSSIWSSLTLLAKADGNSQGGDPETLGNVNWTNVVEPTNGTKVFSQDFVLSINSSEGSDIMVQTDVAAMSTTSGLSYSTVAGLQTICKGQALVPDADTDFDQNSVAFVSCDNRELAGKILDNISNARPACLIMYSLKAQACSFTKEDAGQFESNLGTVFTMMSSSAGRSILSRVNASSSPLSAFVSPSDARLVPTGGGDDDNKSESTKIAMGVLYSLTGLVAALFLFVIISGAIRVHKHPERYGLVPAGGNSTNNSGINGNQGFSDPSNDYSTRAKGLARAVLDSIPLVTFKVGNKSRDAEIGETLAVGNNGNSLEKSTHDNNNNNNNNDDNNTSQKADGSSHSYAMNELSVHETNTNTNNVTPNKNSQELEIEEKHSIETPREVYEATGDESDCPICFEPFKDGEILRILPCKHKFHAFCVDPWLLNTSSQCPLCRVDLSLEREEQVSERPPDEENNSSNSNNEIVIPPGYHVETSFFNRFLDIWNAQLLPKESRRAVLAQFQQEADLRRQLRSQRNEQQREQNRNRWILFVNSRRLLHQSRNRGSEPEGEAPSGE